MKKLIKRHYQAIVSRLLITKKTTIQDFLNKLDEEVAELKSAKTKKEFNQEAIDCMCVIINMLQHFNVKIKKELIKNIEIQEKRANETIK